MDDDDRNRLRECGKGLTDAVLIGPIFTRELVTAPRRTQHFISRGVYGGALLVAICTAFLVFYGTQISYTISDTARFASILFYILAPLQLALITFLAALRGASGVALEKDKRTLILLLMTRLSNHELVLGKLLASLLDVFVMLLAAAPVFLFLTLFGGISTAQVGRVFAVTLVTAVAAGSLGSTVALARDKTFQSLAMTGLVLMIWVGGFEAVAVLGEGRSWQGVAVDRAAAAASPLRAILTAAHPYRDTQPLWGTDTQFVVVALAVAAVLNGVAIWRLRIWNPGRDVLPQQPETEGEAEAAGVVDAEQARAGHVDARVRQVELRSREVWDNPVLWREVRTWAYGKKVIVIKAVYWLLLAMACLSIYSTIRSGTAYARASETIIPATAQPLAPFFVLSLVIVNALAVTSITNERDGGSLDLLLVTDLTPQEILVGKMVGVAYVTWEMLVGPLALCIALWAAGALTALNLTFLLLGLAVMDVFVITLGVHSGMNYESSRTAIGVSLGSVFFLFLGVVTLILFMISFSGSFQTQLAPFLAFIVGGSVGLFVALGIRNASSAIGWAALLLPFATFFAVTNFLVDHVAAAFLVTAATYGFTTAAMLVPALNEFDVASGRGRLVGEE